VEVEKMYKPKKLNTAKAKPKMGGGSAPAAAPAAKAKPTKKRRSLISHFRRSQVDPSA